MNYRDIVDATYKKMRSGLSDEDWSLPRIKGAEPLEAFPEVPLVKAGDGGTWVPIYIYLPEST